MKDTRQVGGSHYVSMAIQPWEVMRSCMSEEEFEGFLRGNVIKYIMRVGRKGDADQALDDLRKAMHYLETLVAFVEGEG